MGLIAGVWLGKYYVLPAVVFRCGRCEVQPAMLPFANVCGFGWKRTRTCQQLHPPTKPSRSKIPHAVCISPKQPRGILANSRVMIAVASGTRSCNMGNASAHEAQHAAGANRIAERKPKPPNFMGKDARLCARVVRSWSPGRVPNQATMVCCIPPSCPAAYAADWERRTVGNKLLQHEPTHCKNNCQTHWTEGIAFHKRCSASVNVCTRLQTRWAN